MHDAATLIGAFLDARTADGIPDRDALERRQERLYRKLQREVLVRSPFYRAHATGPLSYLPIIDKAAWMASFDQINTRGVRLADALALAERAEKTRDFRETLNGLTVGLSTGTSGRRGVFLLSRRERMRWAGVMFAKLAARDPLRPRRVAFLLRANSGLYESAGFGPVRFRYFDMLQPWADLVSKLHADQPDLLIAPAGVLRALAGEQESGRLKIAPARVVSVAECLYPDDREAIRAQFPGRLDEIYQATEGLIASTCEHGVLHLNEAFMHIEPEWLDAGKTRFTPIVTDLTRSTQPVVRYRLDDILVAGSPCACGRAARTIAAIEGRCDDVCSFLNREGEPVAAYPDFLVRAVLAIAPHVSAFQIIQSAPGKLTLCTNAELDRSALERALADLALRLGALPPSVESASARPPDVKRRRVVNLTPKEH